MNTYRRKLFDRLQTIENRTSVRTQIAVGAAALAMLLTAILGGSAAYISYRNTSELMNTTLAVAANSTVVQLNRAITARSQRIKQVSDFLQRDPAYLRSTLDQLQRSISDFAWIGYAGTDGVVTAASGGMKQGASVADEAWFQAGVRGIFVGDIHEARQLTTLLGLPEDGQPQRFIDIAVPVYGSQQEIVGVIGAHLRWSWIEQIIGSAEDTNGDGVRDTSVVLTTADGTVLRGDNAITYNDTSVMTSVEARVIALARRISPDAARSVAVSKPANHNGPGWVVTASQPTTMAVTAAIDTARTILCIGAATGLLGVIFAILIARRIARPIRTITRDADRIGRETGLVMLPRQNGSLETVQLARALRSLLRRVGFAEERSREANASADQLRDDLQQMQHLANTDDLTELLNRRAFLAATDQAIALSRSGTRDSATLMIDIDHFKRINDQYGHATGDIALRRVASIIRGNIGSADHAARFGGEEFVVLLSNIDRAAAFKIAERLRLAMQRADIGSGNIRITATVSIGIAMINEDDRHMQDMIERADRGLYIAKQGGRNRVAAAPL